MSETRDAAGPGDQAGTSPPDAVRPMDVVALRLASAWAGLMPDQTLALAYEGDPAGHGRLTRASLEAPPSANEVLVPARTRAKRPRMSAMRVTLGEVTHHQPLHDHAAAFWSESAVEKFVVPYLAALGGPGAASVLNDLAAAWNGYPDGRQAFALLLRARVEVGASLGLHELLDVLYLEGAEVRQASLRDFLAWCSDGRPVPPAGGVLAPARPTLPRGAFFPTEYQLRVIAEWASALRTEPGYFVYDTAEGQIRRPVPELPVASDGVVIPAFTPRTRADRPVPRVVSLLPEGMDEGAEPLDLSPCQGDAAFWTAGAVSKVMIPYYAMAYGATALMELAEIHRVWEARDAPAGAEPASTADQGVYGLVHLPRSDWGYETADGFVPVIQDMVGAVVARPGEAPGLLSFSELLGRSR